MLIDDTKGIAALQAQTRDQSPEAGETMLAGEGALPEFLAAALEERI